MLEIYNSLNRQKQKFISMTPGEVKIYVCGMTVYDYCHLGHARVLIVFDMVSRWLESIGFNVVYVRNITDIDDKIIQRALDNKESVKELTDRFIAAMLEDSEVLGVTKPTHEPRATEYIQKMISMIDILVTKGLAYQASNNDIYFSVHKFPNYGRLSGKSLVNLRAGARVEIDQEKKDPLDFVLWKSAKPGEPCWDSPWGKGRPGWHIECSAMSEQFLGIQFDIHGGGQDLQFPHHENEIAQSEGCHDRPFVNYWMHNGFVRIDNEKMSKSMGNFFTVREILKRYQPEVIRFFVLRAHYRSPLNYSDQHMEDAKIALDRLYTALKDYDHKITNDDPIDWNGHYVHSFMEAMNDDFNTPEAIAVLFELVTEVNKSGSLQKAILLKRLGAILGLLQQIPQNYLQQHITKQEIEFTPEEIEAIIMRRLTARNKGDYAQADAIREKLINAGIILEDGPDGTTWRRQ